MDFRQTCAPFTSLTGQTAAHRHARVAEDAVEDMLSKMIDTWEADRLYLAPQMADKLRAPVLDLLVGATERLRAECERMYSALDATGDMRREILGES